MSEGDKPMAKGSRRPGTAGRLRSFGFALAGLRFALATQPNLQLQACAAAGAIGLGLALRISPGDWCWVVLAIGLVLSAELLNTAIEHLCDVVRPEPDPSVKAAKDVAAGAVLVAAVAAACIGALVFLPYLAHAFAPPLHDDPAASQG